MGMPCKMNMVDIVIKQLNKTETILDEDFREAKYPNKYSPEITLRGQVNFSKTEYRLNKRFPTLTGDKNPTFGHVLFRVRDLERAGVTLQKGDIIVSTAGISLGTPIMELRYESPLNGRFLLLYAEFERRKESY